ncbi:hypothetical protein [Haloarcula marina]|uniref:hypothetical protein n=1 Tax=Haloarcula marina TaxID=2961574 RepID=UPI0020B839F3|nr:hypothetical protein [Halomicroarcula marina]
MYRQGHLGVTLGIASAGTAYLLHRRFDQQKQRKTETFEKRLANRSPVVLKGIAAVATAGLVSGIVDYDLSLGLGHRTVTHSLATAEGLRHSVPRIGKRVADTLDTISKQWNIPFLREYVAPSIRENASLFGTAITSGIGLHGLGDIPTHGVGGSALQLLWPISSHSFTLGLVSSVSPQLNLLLYQVGVAVAVVSWATVLGRLIFSNDDWQKIRQPVTDIAGRVKGTFSIAKSELTEIIEALRAQKDVLMQRAGTNTRPRGNLGKGQALITDKSKWRHRKRQSLANAPSPANGRRDMILNRESPPHF